MPTKAGGCAPSILNDPVSISRVTAPSVPPTGWRPVATDLLADERPTDPYRPRRLTMKILMVLTSHDRLGDTGRKTGFWLEELAAPYYVFKDAGAEVVLASPKGGVRP